MEKFLEALEKAGINARKSKNAWKGFLEFISLVHGCTEEDVCCCLTNDSGMDQCREFIKELVLFFAEMDRLSDIDESFVCFNLCKQKGLKVITFENFAPLLYFHKIFVGNDGYGSGFL